MTETITLTGVPGTYYVQYSGLANATALKVKREGVSYDIIVSGTPIDKQVLFTASSGKLTFLNAFGGDITNVTDIGRENVYVLYKN